MKNSSEKGKVGEREAAAFLRERGIRARRGVQYQGGTDSPDVVSALPGIHIEVKRTEKFRLYVALQQACDECGGKTPVVFHRMNRRGWVAVLRAEDFLTLVLRGGRDDEGVQQDQTSEKGEVRS